MLYSNFGRKYLNWWAAENQRDETKTQYFSLELTQVDNVNTKLQGPVETWTLVAETLDNWSITKVVPNEV